MMGRLALALALTAGTVMVPARAQVPPADAILVNGKVITLDARSSVAQGIAIRDGRILEVGSNADVRKRAGQRTRVIDLGGRTVIPGLTDGHIHGVRAALTFGAEVNWIGVPSLKEALDKLRQAAAAQDVFCAHTICVINRIYDQSGKGNHLYQAPPGPQFPGPEKGAFDTQPIAAS